MPKLFVNRPTRRITVDTIPQDGNEFILVSRLQNARLRRRYTPYSFAPSVETELASSESHARLLASHFIACAQDIKSKREALQRNYPRNFEIPQDAQEWCTFCLGSKLSSEIYNEIHDEAIEAIAGHSRPPLHIVVHLDQATLITLLTHLYEWYEKIGMKESVFLWFYTVFACIEKPLTQRAGECLKTIYDDFEMCMDPCSETLEAIWLYRLYMIIHIYYDGDLNIDGDLNDYYRIGNNL